MVNKKYLHMCTQKKKYEKYMSDTSGTEIYILSLYLYNFECLIHLILSSYLKNIFCLVN